MQRSRLSSLDLRAFLRSCHCFLQDEMTLDSWTAFQKFLLISEHTDFGNFVKQLKKIPLETQREIVDGFSNGQVESKLWLLETLTDVLPPENFHVKVLGSWFGLLPRLMHWYFEDRIMSVHAYDIDPRWESVAASLNEPESYLGRSRFFTQDMNDIDYGPHGPIPSCVVINTSCEHLENFDAWFDRVNSGNLVVLQGNNFADHNEHAISWGSLDDFKKSAPLETVLFEGTLSLAKYDRYMIIGVK